MSQVVCIRDDWHTFEGTGDPPDYPGPICGQIYTIIGHRNYGDDKYYRLYETPRGWWDSANFKPVKKTDINCFTGMLKTKTKEPEDA